MNVKFILAGLFTGVLLIGAGCTSPGNDAPVAVQKKNEAPAQMPVAAPAKNEYSVYDWKVADMPNISISVPSDFMVIPPSKDNPNQTYTFWPTDQISPLLVESYSSGKVCVRQPCKSEKELTSLNAQELYDYWKKGEIGVSGIDAKIVDLAGHEGLLITSGSPSSITLSFVFSGLYYTVSQNDVNKYISDGQPLFLKIIKTIKFK